MSREFNYTYTLCYTVRYTLGKNIKSNMSRLVSLKKKMSSNEILQHKVMSLMFFCFT